MSKIIDGLKDAAAVATGEKPAATLWHNGHEYVPATRIRELEAQLAAAEAAGVAKGIEMAGQRCESAAEAFSDAAKEFPENSSGRDRNFARSRSFTAFRESLRSLSPSPGMVLVPRAFLKELAPEKPDPDAHDGPCCSTFSDEGGLWLSDGCTCCNSSDAENAEQWRTAMNAVAKFDKLLAKHGTQFRATIGAARE